MTIEMFAPEQIFTDEALIVMAKGQKPLPKVSEVRSMLKEKVKHDEPVAIKDIEKVNTPFRRELMLKKSAELCALTAAVSPSDELLLMMDMFDYLALDWVYSDDLRWDGSLACSYTNKIKEKLNLKLG